MATTPDWISAIGTVLAFFAATGAIILQARELGSQRQELALQRDELRLQREELAKNVEVQQRIAQIDDSRTYISQQVELIRRTKTPTFA